MTHPGWREDDERAENPASCDWRQLARHVGDFSRGEFASMLWTGEEVALLDSFSDSIGQMDCKVQLGRHADELGSTDHRDESAVDVITMPRIHLVAEDSGGDLGSYSFFHGTELEPPGFLFSNGGGQHGPLCAEWYMNSLVTASCARREPHAKLQWPVGNFVFVFVNFIVPLWAFWSWSCSRRSGEFRGVNVYAIWFMVFFITQVGISCGYHRFFTHRVFDATRWVQWLFALVGQLAMQGDAFYWAALHRTHHRRCESDGDPHSPLTNGFFHSHGGFVWNDGSYNFDYEAITPDLLGLDVGWIKEQGILSLVGLPLLSHLIFGHRSILFYLHVPQFLAWHATELINSVCHLWGYVSFNRDAKMQSCESKNVAWLWSITCGEVWHNNHHAMPSSAQFGVAPWELDPAHWVICVLEWVGLVWNVRREKVDGLARATPSTCEGLKVVASAGFLILALRASNRRLNRAQPTCAWLSCMSKKFKVDGDSCTAVLITPNII